MTTTNENTPGADSRGCNRMSAEGNEPTTQMMKEGSIMTVPTTAKNDDATTWLDARDLRHRVGEVNGVTSSLVQAIEDVIETMASKQGKHFVVSYSPRWNAAGEPIGPDIRIDLASAEVLIRAVERVADVLREELGASFVERGLA